MFYEEFVFIKKTNKPYFYALDILYIVYIIVNCCQKDLHDDKSSKLL